MTGAESRSEVLDHTMVDGRKDAVLPPLHTFGYPTAEILMVTKFKMGQRED